MRERDGTRSIVCFSINEWGDVPRNQVHLMRVARSRGYRVLYVETVGLRRPELSRRDVGKIIRRLRRAARLVRRVDDRFWVLSPVALPVHGFRGLDRVNRLLLGLQVLAASRALGFRRPLLWSYLPQTVGLHRILRPSATIYFRCDEYTEYRGVDPDQIERLEREAVTEADLCLGSAEHYLEGVLRPARRAVWIPNGVDLDHFASPSSRDPYGDLPRPILLMTGTLEFWLDTELLRGVAELRPQWTIALAGPLRTDLSALADCENVHYLGVVEYDRLPDFLAAADVCMIPFRQTRFIEGASPGKVYQYLAAGRPVVTTRILSAEQFGDDVYFADSEPEAFVAAVERALAEDRPELQAARRKVVEAHTWQRRFARIEEALAAIA
ncbi:MAG: glycosyltransferase [Actinomycetota bacterium]|nr:glycosyltransferase [Actinomycetota bacterium]